VHKQQQRQMLEEGALLLHALPPVADILSAGLAAVLGGCLWTPLAAAGMAAGAAVVDMMVWSRK
jgi:hypothetical protein